MPLCVTCGKPLHCTPECSSKPASAVQNCPLVKGALWVHVTDDAAADVPDASVKKGGDKKPTDASGIAAFDPLDEGPYDVVLEALSVDLAKRYEPPPPSDSKHSVKVAKGEITYVGFELARKPQLKVKVVKKGAESTVFKDAKVKVTGAASPADKTTQAGTGLADFERVKVGKYEIKTTLTSDDEKTFVVSREKEERELKAGDDVTVTVEVEDLNVVTPKLEPEYTAVLLDPDLAKHQAVDEAKKLFAEATYVELSLEQKNPDHPYAKAIKLKCAPANVEAFLDEECTTAKKVGGNLAAGAALPEDERKLLAGGAKVKVWLRGKTAGKFKVSLPLEDPADRLVKLGDKPPEVELGVVALDVKLHQHDESALVNETFPADKDTLDLYFTALKDKVIPDQKVMTDEEQVKTGRLLHVQKDGNHGRAKLLLKKITADWPAGSDDYDVVLGETCASGGLELYSKEGADGVKQELPYKIKVKDLKTKDVELWVEAKSATAKWRDIVLDAGIDRADGGPVKKPKHRGDWARFTAAQIKEIKLDYTAESGKANAWDSAEKRFFINFKADPDGRKIKLAVELTEKLKDVPIHFMLAPHKDNGKTANWGVDLPTTWKWKDIAEAVKQKDRSAVNKLLHLSKKTDADGKADLEVTLSRFGGDIFEPGAYVTQDPHLARYVREHADLGQRKPVVAAHTIAVWRKFWYQEVKVTGLTVAGFGNAADTYKDVKVVMEAAPAKEMSRSTANGISPRVIYPKHMVRYFRSPSTGDYVNSYPGDTGDGLAVGDNNESRFMSLATAVADMPVMVPMMNVHGLWIGDGVSGVKNVPWTEVTTASFPITLTMDKKSLDPPLQGGTLLAGGTWDASDWDPTAASGAGGWGPVRNGTLAVGDVVLSPTRNSAYQVSLNLPAGLVLGTRTTIRINNLKVNGAASFLGTSYDDGIVNCYTPSDLVDFINTINHELAHSFKQVTKVRPAGVPAHPHQYDQQGSHCRYRDDSCLMFESGPQAVHLDRFCPVCHPYTLVQDWRK